MNNLVTQARHSEKNLTSITEEMEERISSVANRKETMDA